MMSQNKTYPSARIIVFLHISLLLVVVLCAGLKAQAGIYESIATGTYNLLINSCPQTESSPANQTESRGDCHSCAALTPSPVDPSLVAIERVSETLDADIYITKLANGRTEALSCAQTQLRDVLKDPQKISSLTDDFEMKLDLIFRELNTMRKLEPAIRSRIKKTPDQDAQKNAYQMAYTRLNTLLSSLPFMHIPEVSSLITSTLADNEKVFTDSELTKDEKKIFSTQLKKSLDKGAVGIAAEIEILKKPDLNRAIKESLAQDSDLVEIVRQGHEPVSSSYQAAACQVDAAYGKGAEYRDIGFIAASVVAGGAVVGFAKAGASTMAALSSIRGAAAVGNISARTSMVLQSAALSGEAGLQLALANIDRSCGSEGKLRATKKDKCDPSLFSELAHENCVLNVVLTALGAKAVTEGVSVGLKLVTSKSPPLPVQSSVPSSTSVQASSISSVDEVPNSSAQSRRVGDASPPSKVDRAISELNDDVQSFVEEYLLKDKTETESLALIRSLKALEEVEPLKFGDTYLLRKKQSYVDGYRAILETSSKENWAATKTLAAVKSYLNQIERDELWQIAIEEYNSPMHVERFIEAAFTGESEVLKAAGSLARSGGAQVKENLFTALKEGSSDQVRIIAKQFSENKNLAEARQQLVKLSQEVSRSAVGPIALTPRQRQQIRLVRFAEENKAKGMKSHRARVEDVITVRERYPLLNSSIDADYGKLKAQEFFKPVTTPEQIPFKGRVNPANMRQRLSALDPKLRRAIRDVWNRMNDPKGIAEYTRALKEDAAVEMMKSGSKRDIDALSRGVVNRTAVMKVLVARHRAQGNDQFSTIIGRTSTKPSSRTRKTSSNEDFRSAVGQGPFFDRPFNGSRHGVDSHFLQKDYVAAVVYKATGGNPQQFWDFLGSKKGINYWIPLFDSFTTSPQTLARPEDLSHILSPILGITD